MTFTHGPNIRPAKPREREFAGFKSFSGFYTDSLTEILMNPKYHYSPDDRMSKLIADNYQLIQVMTRFGISMGFGDKSVCEVCDENGVDCATFLSVVNFIIDGYSHADSSLRISATALTQYLRQSHAYFLDYCLPSIRRKLLDGIEMRTTDVSFLIIKFFDDYVAKIRRHMTEEEATVFVYVDRLAADAAKSDRILSTYSEHHEEVASQLRELKEIIIKYCPQNADVNLLNAALYEIYRCEDELESHCRIEDELLMPAIKKLERETDHEEE